MFVVECWGMKTTTQFTDQNIVEVQSSYCPAYKKINCDREDLLVKETSWQKLGLSYTATGYGSKIPTQYMISLNGKMYRVYCAIFSNNGTCYIVRKGEKIVISALQIK